MNQEQLSSSHNIDQGISHDLGEILTKVRQDNKSTETDQTQPEQDHLEQTKKTSEQLAAEYFEHHFQERLTLQYLAQLWEQLPADQRSDLASKYSSTDSSQGHEDIALQSHREITASRPKWEDLLPTQNDDESEQQWQVVLADFPEGIAFHLSALQRSKQAQAEILSDPKASELINDKQSENYLARQQASLYGALYREAQRLRTEAEVEFAQSIQFDIPLTTKQRQKMSRLASEADAIERHADSLITRDVVAEIVKRRIVADRMALRRGLVETDEVKGIKSKYVGSLIAGMPMLLVGETGGAKTQIAKYLSREINQIINPRQANNGQEPYELISGHNDINTYQIIGKMELAKEDGVTVTNFAPGPMLRAMSEGRPLIIDEVNAISPDVLKRLNEIFLLRPGQKLKVQENGGETIEIAEGFCIICTANDKSDRYKGIEELSTEFKNRYGPRVERISYPDSEKGKTEFPTELYRIALAALADKYGNVDLARIGTSQAELVNFVRLAHASQKLFSERATTSDSEFVSDRQISDGKTGLDKEVISPRMMVEFLNTLASSGGQRSLPELLQTYLNSIKPEIKGVTNDKAVIQSLLQHFEFPS